MNTSVFDYLDPDINHFSEQDINISTYKNLDQFINDNSYNENDLSILNFNIRSFFKNFDEFSALFMNENFTHDVIVLTETRVKHDTVKLCLIPGYVSYHSYRHSREGGGVSLFIKSKFVSEPFCLNLNSENIECIGAKIKCKNNDDWIKLVGIYRPPSKSSFDFTRLMEKLILDFNLNTSNTLLIGDFNVCILDESLPEPRSLLELFHSFYFRPIILCPTRIAKK